MCWEGYQKWWAFEDKKSTEWMIWWYDKDQTPGKNWWLLEVTGTPSRRKKHQLTFVRFAGNQTAASADVMKVFFWVGWTRYHKKKAAKELKELQPFWLSHTIYREDSPYQSIEKHRNLKADGCCPAIQHTVGIQFILCHDFSALHLFFVWLFGNTTSGVCRLLHVELLGSWPCSTTGSSELHQEGCEAKRKAPEDHKVRGFFDPGIMGSLKVTYLGGDETMEHAYLVQ